MSDFITYFNLQYNKGSDSVPDFTGSVLSFGGTSGANEVRFAVSGGGATTSTPSASWPLATKPGSGTAVYDQAFAFTADTTGVQTTYNGANTIGRMFRWNWDALGTFASPPQFSAFDTGGPGGHLTPSPGTQPSIVNGSSDTSNTSYVKANAYGRGAAASGSTQDTPSAGSVGSAPSATTGTQGSVSPPTTPAWLTNWQHLQGFGNPGGYITDAVTPQATFAAFWYFVLILFYGANQSASTYTWVLTLQYTYT